MNDTFAADRAASEGNWGASVPVRTSRGARPELDERPALRAATGPSPAFANRNLPGRRKGARPERGDPSRQLIDAVLRYFGREDFRLIQSRHTPWASITFSGMRHELTIECQSPAIDVTAKLEAITEDVFALNGHILADITAWPDRSALHHRLIVEALTVESA